MFDSSSFGKHGMLPCLTSLFKTGLKLTLSGRDNLEKRKTRQNKSQDLSFNWPILIYMCTAVQMVALGNVFEIRLLFSPRLYLFHQKQQYCEIWQQFQITYLFLYFKILFPAMTKQIFLVFSVTWRFRNHSNMLFLVLKKKFLLLSIMQTVAA